MRKGRDPGRRGQRRHERRHGDGNVSRRVLRFPPARLINTIAVAADVNRCSSTTTTNSPYMSQPIYATALDRSRCQSSSVWDLKADVNLSLNYIKAFATARLVHGQLSYPGPILPYEAKLKVVPRCWNGRPVLLWPGPA